MATHVEADSTLTKAPFVSIDNHEDFSDLAEFGRDIEGKSIIYLDELTHGEHQVFALKSRLIKYLHQHHGFDVVLLESGLFDVHEIWKNQTKSLVEQGPGNIFYAYASDHAFQDLMQYVDKYRGTPNPLFLSGFDGRLSGEHSTEYFVKTLKEVISKHLPRQQLLNDWDRYSRLLQASLERKKLPIDNETASSHIEENYQLIDQLQSIDAHQQFDSPAYYAQLLKGVNRVFEVLHGFRRHDEHDIVMADNIQWMLNNVYKNKKVIVWGHYIHVNPLGFVKLRYDNLGSILDKSFAENSFYVNFQGISGNYKNYIDGSTVAIPKLKSSHFAANLPYHSFNAAQYFNIGQLNTDNALKQKKLFGHGYQPEFDISIQEAKQHFDATFIIKQLTPSK